MAFNLVAIHKVAYMLDTSLFVITGILLAEEMRPEDHETMETLLVPPRKERIIANHASSGG